MRNACQATPHCTGNVKAISATASKISYRLCNICQWMIFRSLQHIRPHQQIKIVRALSKWCSTACAKCSQDNCIIQASWELQSVWGPRGAVQGLQSGLSVHARHHCRHCSWQLCESPDTEHRVRKMTRPHSHRICFLQQDVICKYYSCCDARTSQKGVHQGTHTYMSRHKRSYR